MTKQELQDKLAGYAKTAYQYKGDITADTPSTSWARSP